MHAKVSRGGATLALRVFSDLTSKVYNDSMHTQLRVRQLFSNIASAFPSKKRKLETTLDHWLAR